MKKITLAVVALVLLAGAAAQAQRDQIRIVGSSTVYPFATKVAEQFGRGTRFKTPVIESTGSGGGFKLFCSGVGVDTPDITNASRAIKDSEVETCKKNGVTGIAEIKIGFDGIVVASSAKAPRLSLTRKQLYMALAKDVPGSDGNTRPNPYRTWNEIDPALPKTRIEVLGPPPTSGTRDAFTELVMDKGCEAWDWVRALQQSDEGRFKAICQAIREDGAYIEAGENDNLIVQKLEANAAALGIFGFSFLDENADKIQGSLVDGVAPTFENIADARYPVSRPLFFYVKTAHVGVIPGIREYVQEFTSERAWGEDGYLSDAGLIPLPAGERQKAGEEARSLANNVG